MDNSATILYNTDIMRLYLSSYKFGDFTDELVKLVGNHKKVAVIGNSRDWSEDRERASKGLQEQIKERLGIARIFG